MQNRNRRIGILNIFGNNRNSRIPAVAGSLFNLKEDVGETTDLSRQHPERVAGLTKRMKAFQAKLKKNTHPIGRITEVPEDVKKQQENRTNR